MAEALAVAEGIPPELVFDFDIYGDSRVHEDVQGSYATALEGAPDIFYTTRNGGHWMVRRYDAIAAIVMDYEHFSVREMQIPRVPNPPFFIPLSLDPPANLPYRQAMMPRFSPKAIRELEPKIRQWAAQIVDEVADAGECDFIGDVSSRFPVSVFMELMGIPLPRLRECRQIAQEFFMARTQDEFELVSEKIFKLLGELIEHRRQNPSSDLISHFIEVDVGGRKLNPDEILAMCFVLFLGGMDTVTNLTGFSFQHLARDPDLQKRLAGNSDLLPSFVDESLRCFGVINTPRLVVKDCDLFDVHFRSGDMVLCLLSVVGRDDRANAEADVFNIDRRQGSHLTFSTGPHLCIGHLLARTEIRILTEEWLKRVPSFWAKPNVRHGFRIGTVNAIDSLPLQWSVISQQ
jgi:cytochrome P450